MRADTLRTYRWTRRAYGRLIDEGILCEDDPIELLDGLLVVKEPRDTPHTTAIDLVSAVLRTAFGPEWLVRAQAPMAADRWSEPEPDVYVVPGGPRDYLPEHPTRPVLIVEVAQGSLRLDRTRKAAIYARAGVEDYWIVNLVDRQLEVRREPTRLESPRRRWDYRSIVTLGPNETVTPLAAPTARISVADLLP
jgi:Uma2 family endonuclease